MKHLRLLPLALTVALAASTHTAFAQRERAGRDERREQRQQENANLTPQQRMQNFQSRMQERMKSMTPEQRASVQSRINDFMKKMNDAGIDPNDPNAMQKARDAGLFNAMGLGMDQNGNNGNPISAEDAMRQMMIAAGITEVPTQDAVIAHVSEQNKARVTLLQLAKDAARALQTPATVTADAATVPAVAATATTADVAPNATDAKTADEKVVRTFEAYNAAAESESERNKKALQELDAKVSYSTNPRLKSFLTLVGVLDNNVLALGGPAAVFPPAAPAAPRRRLNE